MPTLVEPPPRRWTRAEYVALDETGLLNGQHVELVEGELISKMGKKRPHVTALTLMNAWLTEVFGKHFVNPAAPIDVAPEDNPTNEPEPDVIVLNRDMFEIEAGNPVASDLHLVVEAADSSLNLELTTKASLYARAGIVEYWVLDVRGQRLIVHREPRGGRYLSIAAYSRHEMVSPLAAPEAKFQVAMVLEN